MRESEIKYSIIKQLEKWGYEVVIIIQTNKNGWPDLEAMRNKILTYIETKQAGKDARPLQEYRHRKLRAQGFEVIVASSLNDIQHLK